VEYPDIPSTCLKIGASPTTRTGKYTLPVTQDNKTGAVISESWNTGSSYLEHEVYKKALLSAGGHVSYVPTIIQGSSEGSAIPSTPKAHS
ncbi:hypothetical protein L218DRAFT_859653, partial [Marasmius fiardii PR-910]